MKKIEYEKNKKERIIAAKKFAKGLNKLFKEFHKKHKAPFFISIGNNTHDIKAIKISDTLYSVALLDIWKKGTNLIDLR
jgi:hypothetical protein